MSSKGFVATLLNPLPADEKKVLVPAFDHVMDDAILGTATKAANFRWVRVTGTTPSVAFTEFSIAHGLGVAPTWIIPALDLSVINSQLVPLYVTRVPDAQRVYLGSSFTDAGFTVFLEY